MKRKPKNRLYKPFYCMVLMVMFVIIFIGCFPGKKSAEIAVQNTNNEHTVSAIHPTLEMTELYLSSESVPAEGVISALTESASAQSAVKVTVNQTAELPVPKNFVLIPSGIFQMGNKDGEYDEIPVHQVMVNAFYISKYEVTQKEYAVIMGNNPSSFKGDDLPVEMVSWYNAVEYCNRLSLKEGLQPAYQGESDIICNFSATGYRLLTEAEWEYAALGKNQQKYSGNNIADKAAWYNINSNGKTNTVGTKTANSFGIYDMSGNVAEWCWDIYGVYNNESQNNPTGSADGKTRVLRGGHWGNNERNIRITSRSQGTPVTKNSSIGFRIVRSAL